MTWIGNVVVIVCLAIGIHHASSEISKVRWCTISGPEEAKCAEMRTAFASNSLKALECVAGASVQDCMGKISANSADLITLDGGDVYVAGLKYNMIPIMQEVYADNVKGYHAVAAVKVADADITINNLEGKRSCHTGVRKTAGWNVPIGFLLESGMINPSNCQDDIRAAGNFFNGSCAPGALSSAYNPDGNNPVSLCELCQNKNADNPCPRNSDEDYYNYAGAFRCLAAVGGGDVAFIKPVTITSNTDGNNNDPWATNLRSQDFELLCPDGTRASVADYERCFLAFVPSHAVMASKKFDSNVLQDFRNVLKQAQDLFGVDGNANGFSMFASSSGNSDLLFKDSTESLEDVVNKEYTEYLGQDYLDTLKGLDKCPANSLRWCVTSPAEKKKCQAMKTAFSGANLSPPVSCYTTYAADDACARDITNDIADVVTLDGGKLYQYGELHGVAPIMAEDYGEGDASYWAVAVVKRTSSFTINELKGKKSCHTGYLRTAGWKVPIGYLINRGDINVDNECDVPQAVGDFFSQSCVPSVLEPGNNPNGNNPANLCEICAGTGDNKCKGDATEPYAGYNGAFRCLVEDAGDVAFVKHTTVGSNTGGTGSQDWNTGLQEADYQLLCPDGTRADPDNFMNCNLAKVPAHVVVTAGKKTDAQRQEMVNLLTSGQAQFKSDEGNAFKMFDSSDASYGNHQGNLLFKDSTVELLPTGDKDTFDKYLSKEYLDDIRALDCKLGGSSAATRASLPPSLLLLLGALAIVRFIRG